MTESKVDQIPDKKHTTRARLRVVEELYISGYGPKDIHEKIKKKFPVRYGTLRNDIVDIRKAWAADLDGLNVLEGKHRYFAAMQQVRRKAMDGWEEGDAIKGRDYKLAHTIDQEIARLSGVRLKSDEKTIHLDIQEAKGFIEKVMEVVFEVVEDPDLCETIVKRLEELAVGDQALVGGTT